MWTQLSKCMHKSIMYPHLIAFVLTDTYVRTYYIICYSKYDLSLHCQTLDTMAEVSYHIAMTFQKSTAVAGAASEGGQGAIALPIIQ